MIRVGCCGYPVSKNSYYKEFNLVEINSTFYEYPKMALLEKWRKEAPKDFTFTVKAHQDISHKHRLEPNPECLKSFERMTEICQILGAQILLIQSPASFKPSREALMRMEEFFRRTGRLGLETVWESRGSGWEQPDVRTELANVLERVSVTHVTDSLKGMPAYIESIAYFRLHGLGPRKYYYQYSKRELNKLVELLKAIEGEGKAVFALFNNLAMWEDGRRFQTYLKTGVLPPLTETVGLDSIREILKRTRFPATKSGISKSVGWRLAEARNGEEVSLDALLAKLPNKAFKSIDEVVDALRWLANI